MLRKIILTTAVLIFLLPLSASANKKAKAPSKKQQQANFTEAYKAAEAQGAQALADFKNDTAQYGSDYDNEMMTNLGAGRNADGSKKSKRQLAQEAKAQEGKPPAGFMGDPNDPGPQDWSDYNIKTDGKGNVIGFEEKDFKEKDKDGDGEISQEEREEWDKKKDEENQQAGGAPGEVPPIPEWDRDQDGKPDKGFERYCWVCRPGDKILNECHDGQPGPCDDKACGGDIAQKCTQHTEIHDNKTYVCHNCHKANDQIPWCEEKGFSSAANCNGRCPPIACVPLDIDIKTGQILSSGQSRVKGSTRRCYGCMRIKSIEITYVIVIIETPLGRFVLKKKGEPDHFEPSSVMALAEVGEGGTLQNTLGQFKDISAFMGAFNIGMGLGGVTTSPLSLEQLSGLLSSKFEKRGGKFTGNCFDDVVEESVAQAEGGAPDKKKRKKKRKGTIPPVPTAEEMAKRDKADQPAITGPIVACGQMGKEKVMNIYDASGALVDTITRAAYQLNPNIIAEKLAGAQELSSLYSQITRTDISGLFEKFTGIPVGKIQSYAARVQQVKSKVDQVVDMAKSKKKKKKKKKKVEEAKPVTPNDPLYQHVSKKKKKGLLGILGGGASEAQKKGLKIGASALGLDTSPRARSKTPDVKDQYGIQAIGFTPVEDSDSAWNVIDVQQKNITVAVIDSGLDFDHEDAPQYIWTNEFEVPDNGIDDDGNGFIDDIYGWNFLNENHDFTDIRGHGTFVSGIIAAKMNNGVGIAGINPGAVIMPLKVANEEGETHSFHIYRAINYAVSHGARVINVSLGARGISEMERMAIQRAHDMGVFVAIAAGNNGESITMHGPASADHGFAVGQTDLTLTRSTVSNWGPNLGVIAPGEQIYSLCSGDNKHVLPSVRKFGYYKQDGTSFSTPMVAGVASLLLAKNPKLSNVEIETILMGTADDMKEAGWDALTGAGFLNAQKALRTDEKDFLIVRFTNFKRNKDKRSKKFTSVDVFGTVRGNFKEFVIEAGKGKRPGSFKQVAGPYTEAIDYNFITRIDIHEHLRGSKDWVLRMKVTDQGGQEHLAILPVEVR